MKKQIQKLIYSCLSKVSIANNDRNLEAQLQKIQQSLILKQFYLTNIFFIAIFVYQALKCLMDETDNSFKYILDLFGLAIIIIGIAISIRNQDNQVHHCENFNLLLALYILLCQFLVEYNTEFKEEMLFSEQYVTILLRTICIILQIQVAHKQSYILILTIIGFINLGLDGVQNEFHIFPWLILLIQYYLRFCQEKCKRLLVEKESPKIAQTRQQKIEEILKDYQSQNQIILFQVKESSILENQDFRFIMMPQLDEYNDLNSDILHSQSEDKLELIYRNQYSEKIFPGEQEINTFLQQLFVKNSLGKSENFNLFCINFACQRKVFYIQIENCSFSKSSLFSASRFPLNNNMEGQYSVQIAQCYILDEFCLLVQIQHNKIEITRNINKSRKSSIEQNAENFRIDQEIQQEQRIVNLAKNISFGISHEFKTPLNAIQLLCESCIALIQLKDFNKNQLNDILHDIQHHNKIMFCKVNEFLDMKKIVEGTFDYNRSQFDLHELLDQLKAIFIEQFRNKGVEFIIEIKLKNSVVYQDRQRLLQILINVVGNALKFTFAGYVKLTITKLLKKEIFFEVQDSGIGISKEAIQSLFQLQDGEQQQRKQGSGFGLTITKHVLDRIGPKNSIKAQSIQEKGTSLQFQIFRNLFLNQESKTYFVPSENASNRRRIQSILIQPQNRNSASIMSQSINRQRKELRILIVDDTSINITALKFLMKLVVKQKFTIDEAYNGQQGVNKFKANYFDVIFMDINMPIMDGFEAIKEIRKFEEIENRKKSIIAIVTAFSPEEMKKSSCDANTILYKPIQKDQILNFFDEFVQNE